MKDIRPIRGHNLIQRLVTEGEHLHQDFKFAISDAHKIAHSFSAFANADGGHLLVGVKDNGAVAGIRTDEDIYLLQQAAQMYCDPPLPLDIKAYRMEDGKVVVKASVKRAVKRPVYCIDSDGHRLAYMRVADENILAHPLLVRSWNAVDRHHARILSDIDSRLVALVDQSPNGVNPDRVASLLHTGQATAATSIVTMTALGLIRFEPVGGGHFALLPAEQQEE